MIVLCLVFAPKKTTLLVYYVLRFDKYHMHLTAYVVTVYWLFSLHSCYFLSPVIISIKSKMNLNWRPQHIHKQYTNMLFSCKHYRLKLSLNWPGAVKFLGFTINCAYTQPRQGLVILQTEPLVLGIKRDCARQHDTGPQNLPKLKTQP